MLKKYAKARAAIELKVIIEKNGPRAVSLGEYKIPSIA
jgi:hypothetical protein